MPWNKSSDSDFSTHIARLAAQPERWDDLPINDLKTLAVVLFALYGKNGDGEEIPRLFRLYQVLNRRCDHEERMALCMNLSDLIESRRTSVLALMPVLQVESDAAVISTAAVAYASLMPKQGDDPISGPRFLARLLDPAGSKTSLGILMGLVLVGDERILPLISGRWREFDEEDRVTLAGARSGLVSTAQIEFLLDWLESTDSESDVGGIAGTLAAMPGFSGDGCVRRIRRHFPVFDAPDEPIVCLAEWSFPQYAALIKPRLMPLIEREGEPKVLPFVLRAWGAA
jgi:hypothetical protein